MRYARVEIDHEHRVGVVTSHEPGSETVTLFPPGIDLLDAAVARSTPADGAPTFLLDEVRLLAPVRPSTFRDFVAFEEHVQGAASMTADPAAALETWARRPAYLYGSPHAILGPGEPVAGLPDDDALDFELEVGVVIGRDGRNIAPEAAAAHIAGYLIVNDWSARALQRQEMRGGLGPAKSKDFATTIGPWLVTPDELEPARIGDRLDLRMSVSVNDVVIGGDSLAHMGWSFEQLISHASRSAWVRAGDLIASGTCAGGSLAEAWGRTGVQEPRPLQPGDVVAMTVERLGTLVSQVVAAAAQPAAVPPARPLAQLKAATGGRR